MSAHMNFVPDSLVVISQISQKVSQRGKVFIYHPRSKRSLLARSQSRPKTAIVMDDGDSVSPQMDSCEIKSQRFYPM